MRLTLMVAGFLITTTGLLGQELEFRVDTEQQRYELGESFTAHAYVRNSGERPVFLKRADFGRERTDLKGMIGGCEYHLQPIVGPREVLGYDLKTLLLPGDFIQFPIASINQLATSTNSWRMRLTGTLHIEGTVVVLDEAGRESVLRSPGISKEILPPTEESVSRRLIALRECASAVDCDQELAYFAMIKDERSVPVLLRWFGEMPWYPPLAEALARQGGDVVLSAIEEESRRQPRLDFLETIVADLRAGRTPCE